MTTTETRLDGSSFETTTEFAFEPHAGGTRMTAEAQRRLILHMSVSLDGFVARKDGVIDWVGTGEQHGATRHHAKLEMNRAGRPDRHRRGAYQDMVQAWPSSDTLMGRLINRLPKVVFSNSLDMVEWENARLNEALLEQEIPRLKGEPGQDIVVFGGGRIAHSLIRHRLVDELRLTVHPVALGDGISLMHGLPEPQRFERSAPPSTPTAASSRYCGPAEPRMREPLAVGHGGDADRSPRWRTEVSMSTATLEFDGRVAMATGASRGIGAATPTRLAAYGARVGVGGRDRDAIDRVVARSRADGGQTVPTPADRVSRGAPVRRVACVLARRSRPPSGRCRRRSRLRMSRATGRHWG